MLIFKNPKKKKKQLQRKEFSKQQFDNFAYLLNEKSIINPHKSNFFFSSFFFVVENNFLSQHCSNLKKKKIFTYILLIKFCFLNQNLIPHFLTPIFFFLLDLFGFGNYDVNVLMMALMSMGLECVWFDSRKELEKLKLEKLFGVIANICNNSFFSSRHWICFSRIEDNKNWFKFDSLLSAPIKVDDLLSIIRILLVENVENQVFLVVEKDQIDKIYQENPEN